MQKNRLEAFSDGVLAIIITIMVLELKVPPGGAPDLSGLKPLAPVFGSYVLSFFYIGIYWNNHHHLIHAASKVSSGILWANLHLLFWLSLMPFATAWFGHYWGKSIPTAAYGVVLLCGGIAYNLLQQAIMIEQGHGSLLRTALGRDWKGKLSLVIYAAAIPLALIGQPWVSFGLYVLVAVLWVIPDRRIANTLAQRQGN